MATAIENSEKEQEKEKERNEGKLVLWWQLLYSIRKTIVESRYIIVPYILCLCAIFKIKS